jgi:AcrR family transcriptional regulator
MTSRRPYRSPLRDEHARHTRTRVLDAARDLFLATGYTATTIEQIAGAADVSVQTVYNAVGNKAVIAAAVYDTTLAGDDRPVAIADRPTFQAMLAESSARRCLARYAELSRELAERVAPLLAVFVAEAGNPDLRALVERAELQRAEGSAGVARHVADRFGLAPHLTLDEAADILWALTAPETMSRLVQQRNWTWDRYQAWLADTMAHSLHRRR